MDENPTPQERAGRRNRSRPLAASMAIAALLSAGLVTAPAAASAALLCTHEQHCTDLGNEPVRYFDAEVALAVDARDVEATGSATFTASVMAAPWSPGEMEWAPESGGRVLFANATTGKTALVPMIDGVAAFTDFALVAGYNSVTASYEGYGDDSRRVFISSTSSVQVNYQVAPPAPQNVSATSTAGAARITWTAPVTDPATQATGFMVTVSQAGATVRTLFTSTPEALVLGLRRGQSYVVAVVASNASGRFSASRPVPLMVW